VGLWLSSGSMQMMSFGLEGSTPKRSRLELTALEIALGRHLAARRDIYGRSVKFERLLWVYAVIKL